MTIRLEDLYPGRTEAADANYPDGSFKNETTPTVPATPISSGSNDGTPLDKDWANDKEGYFQGLISESGVTPSGSVDTAAASQLKDAAKIVHGGAGAYEATINYPVGSRSKGSDNAVYQALIASGPASSVVDPVGDLTGTWVQNSTFNIVEISASGSYVKPAGLKFIKIKGVGGGGSGGATNLGAGTGTTAGGGGSSGWFDGVIMASDLAASEAVTIGAGAGGATAINPGNTGGTTSFGSFVQATGGNGGAVGGNTALGGASGQGSILDPAFVGSAGYGSPGEQGNSNGSGLGVGGAGASSPIFGGGAQASVHAANGNQGFDGGGSSGTINAASTSAAGNGKIVIEEHF